jgi:hypothetical protein
LVLSKAEQIRSGMTAACSAGRLPWPFLGLGTSPDYSFFREKHGVVF